MGDINDQFTGPERKAALCALLEQETQLIGSIDRRKIDAYKEGKEKKIMQFLNKVSKRTRLQYWLVLIIIFTPFRPPLPRNGGRMMAVLQKWIHSIRFVRKS